MHQLWTLRSFKLPAEPKGKMTPNLNWLRKEHSLVNLDLVDRLERLQSICRLSENQWLDLLEVTWKEYFFFRSGLKELPSKSIHNLAFYLKISPDDIIQGSLDYPKLISLIPQSFIELPEKYQIAQYGKQRTTLTSLEFIEKKFGWRLKNEVLDHLDISEAALNNPFAPISISVITDICDYLKQRGFSDQDVFSIGFHSFEANRHSVLAKVLKSIDDKHYLYHLYFTEILKLLERNCFYNYSAIAEDLGMLTMRSIPEVVQELGQKHLGSAQLCHLKSGVFASIPGYIGLTAAKVLHTTCEHRGDDVCRFMIDFSDCQSLAAPNFSAAKVINHSSSIPTAKLRH